jgi:uroporphyrinogen-III synthase
MRVIVTRPAAQARPWVDALHALGVEAVALPLIGIAPAADPAPIEAAWAQLGDAKLVMFVSANAVEHFFAARPAGRVWPPALRAGSTGPGTTAALRAAGLDAAQVVAPPPDAPTFDSEALWRRLAGEDWRGEAVWIVRGEGGREWFADTLRAAGAQVHALAAYRRTGPAGDEAARTLIDAALAAPRAHLWHFSSSEAVAHLTTLATGAAGGRAWAEASAVASHPRIEAAVRRAGFGTVAFVPPSPQALAAWVRARGSAGEAGAAP